MARVPLAERRNDLVQAAVQVIAERGIEGATTRRIADQAGSPLTMLHYCYDSKEDLFADVYQHVSSQLREVLTQSDPHSDLATTALALARGLMKFYVETPEVTAALLELISWARRQHTDPAITVYNQAYDVARSVLNEAAAAQDVGTETVEEIAYVVGTVCDGFALNWLTYGDPSVAAQQMELAMSVLDMWLASKLVPRRRRRANTSSRA